MLYGYWNLSETTYMGDQLVNINDYAHTSYDHYNLGLGERWHYKIHTKNRGYFESGNVTVTLRV